MLIVDCGPQDPDVLQRFELTHFCSLYSVIQNVISDCSCESGSRVAASALTPRYSPNIFPLAPMRESQSVPASTFTHCVLHLDMPEMCPEVNFLFFPSLSEAQGHRWGVLPLRSASATSALELRSQLWVLYFSSLCGLFIHTQLNYRPVREGGRCWLIIQKMHKYTFRHSFQAYQPHNPYSLSSNLSWNF